MSPTFSSRRCLAVMRTGKRCSARSPEPKGLTTAFFFSTEAALAAHQAFLPSPDQLRHLATGFLGQVRDGMFTAGEDVYPN